MNKYTVILLRPDYLCDDTPYGQDVYVGYVECETVDDAIDRARHEVFKGDKLDGMGPKDKLDYALCVAFLGHNPIALFGWQT